MSIVINWMCAYTTSLKRLSPFINLLFGDTLTMWEFIVHYILDLTKDRYPSIVNNVYNMNYIFLTF